MAVISSAYHYYLATYGGSKISRYDTHKKSELRNIWNSIVKINKDAPLYKIKHDAGNSIPKFLIDLKEHARNINNVVASLSTSDEGIAAAFEKKVVYSSQEDIITARYIGEDARYSTMDNFQVQVDQLAKPQINLGSYLNSNGTNLPPGSHMFELSVKGSTYEFQFSINESDTNLNVQNKLAYLIQNANIGLSAEVLTDEGMSSLQITSTQTGIAPDEDALFTIQAIRNTPSAQVLDTLGIASTAQKAQNSSFRLNGQQKSSFSNTFTINREFEVTLKGLNQQDSEAIIGFKLTSDAVADNIQELVDSYNGMIQTADKYEDTPQQSFYLRRDIVSSAREYENELESVGLILNENGSIQIDKALLTDAITRPNSKEEIFSVLNNFKDLLGQRASEVSLNPMKYVNKVIVTYKNPGHNFATPYISSIYSGMMLDHYC